jgi:colanic acid biosynthesis glycosyl transferase WcaI
VEQRGLSRVLLIEHQPYARMPEIYAASDVCLVPLLGDVDGSALPSKVFRIMACGRPVLALCDPGSELAALVNAAGAGVVVPPGRPELLLAAVNELAASAGRRAAMGRSGRAYVERFHDRGAVTARYAELVTTLSSGRRS